MDKEIKQMINKTFISVGNNIEKSKLRDSLEEIFGLVRFGNKFFDTEKPWYTRSSDITACENTIFNCIQLIANLSVLLAPFLPFSSVKVGTWLKLTTQWKPQYVESGFFIPKSEILFERLDKMIVEYELEQLKL
jgi:methionyl-tRNA synthetase